MRIGISVNGTGYEADVEARMLLVDLLRDELGLTGTHIGCEDGKCGACTVLLDGQAQKSCMVFAVQADGAEVETVEGLATGTTLHPLQAAFHQAHALQCGYCTPGFLMTTKALLALGGEPTEAEIRKALAGNLCRCTGYTNIVKAVLDAAEALRRAPTGAEEAVSEAIQPGREPVGASPGD
jgi:aerobic carbon-monoxide dehydrogenase small subunit